MAKASKKSPEEKLRVVLSVLRGEQSAVDAVLTLPAMQRRLMHLQLPRQPGHRATVAHLLHDHRAKLR